MTWETSMMDLFSQNALSSVIRQKGKSQNGVSRKQGTPNFPKNEHFLLPDTQTSAWKSGLFTFLLITQDLNKIKKFPDTHL